MYIQVIKSVCDAIELQRDLNKTQDWFTVWLLNLNLEKCKVMHTGKTLDTSYTMETSTSPRSHIELSEVNFQKDLCIWSTSSLKSSLHCDKAAVSATRVLEMLKRTFTMISKELFIFLYKTYVRPHLEYCVQLWCSYLARDINTLERVQRKTTKLVPNCLNFHMYQDRESLESTQSLYCQRKHRDLIKTIEWLLQYWLVWIFYTKPCTPYKRPSFETL